MPLWSFPTLVGGELFAQLLVRSVVVVIRPCGGALVGRVREAQAGREPCEGRRDLEGPARSLPSKRRLQAGPA